MTIFRKHPFLESPHSITKWYGSHTFASIHAWAKNGSVNLLLSLLFYWGRLFNNLFLFFSNIFWKENFLLYNELRKQKVNIKKTLLQRFDGLSNVYETNS